MGGAGKLLSENLQQFLEFPENFSQILRISTNLKISVIFENFEYLKNSGFPQLPVPNYFFVWFLFLLFLIFHITIFFSTDFHDIFAIIFLKISWVTCQIPLKWIKIGEKFSLKIAHIYLENERVMKWCNGVFDRGFYDANIFVVHHINHRVTVLSSGKIYWGEAEMIFFGAFFFIGILSCGCPLSFPFSHPTRTICCTRLGLKFLNPSKFKFWFFWSKVQVKSSRKCAKVLSFQCVFSLVASEKFKNSYFFIHCKLLHCTLFEVNFTVVTVW